MAVYSFTEAIIHSRITNDEKVLKKVLKRFHTYASVAHPLHPPETRPEQATIEEAKELFRVELESFHLTLKKAVLVCEAERRQVEQYEREKQRIGVWQPCTSPSLADPTLPEDEREALKGHIEQLKTSLEDAQLSRRQMVEYDLIAEKINQLPSRDELQQQVPLSPPRALKTSHELTLTDPSILSRMISRPFFRNMRHKPASFRLRKPHWILSSAISVLCGCSEKIQIFYKQILPVKTPRTSLMTRNSPKNLFSTPPPSRLPLPEYPPPPQSHLSPNANFNPRLHRPASPPLLRPHLSWCRQRMTTISRWESWRRSLVRSNHRRGKRGKIWKKVRRATVVVLCLRFRTMHKSLRFFNNSWFFSLRQGAFGRYLDAHEVPRTNDFLVPEFDDGQLLDGLHNGPRWFIVPV